MYNHPSTYPAPPDGDPVSVNPLAESVGTDRDSRPSHVAISSQTRDVPILGPEYDLTHNISTWRAGLTSANEVESLPSQQLPIRYPATFDAPHQAYASREVAEPLEPGSRRNSWIGGHSTHDSSPDNFSDQSFPFDTSLAVGNNTNDFHASADETHPPLIYQPEQGFQKHDVAVDSNFPVCAWNVDQQSQQVPRPTVFRGESEVEDGGFRAEARATGVLPSLLSLYGFPLVKRRSHSSSTIGPSGLASRANSDSFQTLGMLGLRKRHDSLLSANSDASTDLDDTHGPRETDTNGLVDKLKSLFRNQTPNNRVAVIRKNVVPLSKRHKYILNLAKALIFFGAPSHRIESQLVSSSKVLEIESHFVHLPNVVICTFGNMDTKTSQTHFIKANGRIMLGKLHNIHSIFRMVCHDEISADAGSIELCKLLKSPPIYGLTTRVALAFCCAAIICPMAFGGTLVEMGIAGLCGGTLAFLQLFAAKRSSMYADVFEISIAVIMSFIARLLSAIPGDKLCYQSISSAGVVLILPGYLILASSLELASKNMLCGSVRMVYAIIYSLFLGFGLTMGSDVGFLVNSHLRQEFDQATKGLMNSIVISGRFISENTTSPIPNGSFQFTNVTQAIASNIIKGCYRNPDWAWYFKPFPTWTLVFLVPLYTFCSTSWNLQPWKSKQLPAMITISCCSYAANKLASNYILNRADVASAIGAFVVGILGNLYSRIWGGTAFTAMLPGVLTLVPAGIAAAGGLAENYRGKSSDQYSTSIIIGFRMVQVAIGVTVGLFGSGLLVYSFGRRKKNALFAF